MAYLSPYRAQLKAVAERLPPPLRGVEALTIDKGQGRDFECLLLSMVRSNADGATGSLLADWRRLNVAFSRAKRKLLVVGSRRTLQQSPMLASFLEMADQRGWCLQLPPRAHQLYPMPPLPAGEPAPPASPAPPAPPAPPAQQGSGRRHGAGHAPPPPPIVPDNMPITANLVHEIHQVAPARVPGGGGQRVASAAQPSVVDW